MEMRAPARIGRLIGSRIGANLRCNLGFVFILISWRLCPSDLSQGSLRAHRSSLPLFLSSFSASFLPLSFREMFRPVERMRRHHGLALTRFCNRGVVWGFLLAIPTPLTCPPMLEGVGAPLSSSVFTVDGRLRLLLAGLVLALGPLEFVPC